MTGIFRSYAMLGAVAALAMSGMSYGAPSVRDKRHGAPAYRKPSPPASNRKALLLEKALRRAARNA